MRRLPPENPSAGAIAEPSFGRFAGWCGRLYNRRILRREQQIVAIEVRGAEHLTALRARGEGILVTPNHPDQADPYVLFEVAARCGGGFAFMAAVQLFQGSARKVLPRIGGFPIDRDGTDLRAFKTAVDLMTQGRPLVVFPEGEVYHLSDRLTPLREGAAAMAVTASKRLAALGKSAYVVPVAIKYRYLHEQDQTKRLHEALDVLERRTELVPARPGRGLVDRIYDLAEQQVEAREIRYLGAAGSGPIRPRIETLRDTLLERLETRRFQATRSDPVPIRVKELRRACLEELSQAGQPTGSPSPAQAALEDLHMVLQLFSYPGDYVRSHPSLGRVAETIRKFEEDLLGDEVPPPRGPRRAVVHLGTPIPVTERIATLGKPRHAIGPITAEMESRMQALLDEIGSGAPLHEPI